MLHVGLPTLTKTEEKQIETGLLEYPNSDQLTFKEALSYVCQLVMEKMKENFQYDMTCLQIEWFYGRFTNLLLFFLNIKLILFLCRFFIKLSRNSFEIFSLV